MSIYFWSDPHLGLTRTSHTTATSRVALRAALHKQAAAVSAAGPAHRIAVCLGDLFDTTSNDEAVIREAHEILRTVDFILAGNHDLPNREGKVSSLELLSDVTASGKGKVINAPFIASVQQYGELVFVPHKVTQEMFIASLQQALDEFAEGKVLCLHCNYDNAFAASSESTLNLPREMAKQLLDKFQYILIGHEHIPRSDFGGKLQIAGNTHPTSFSDISDKFVWELRDGVLTPTRIWSMADHYQKIEWQDLVDGAASQAQFVEVVGAAPADKMSVIAQAVGKLWRDNNNALMVRNAVVSEDVEIAHRDFARSLDVPARITQELEASPALAATWAEYLGRAREGA